jgi:hypothetical protein
LKAFGEEIDNGYFDNVDNEFLNKYENNFKNRKFYEYVFLLIDYKMMIQISCNLLSFDSSECALVAE